MAGPIGHLLDEWHVLRAKLSEVDKRLHPDIVDRFGRAWVWIGGDLYAHDSMAWTRGMIEHPQAGLPSESARSNPNYSFCDICRGQRP